MQERQSRPVLRARRSLPRTEPGGSSSATRTPRVVPNDSSPRMSSNHSSEVTETLTNPTQLTTISNESVNNNTPKRSDKPQRPKIVARRRIPETATQNLATDAETEAPSTSTPDPINTIPDLVTQSLSPVNQIGSTTEAVFLSGSAELSSEAVKEDKSVHETKAVSDEITESCEKDGVESAENKKVTKENKDAVNKKEEEKAAMEEHVFQRILRQKMVCDICMTHMKLYRCSKCFYSMCNDCTITITTETPGSVKCPHCREEQKCFMQIRLPKF